MKCCLMPMTLGCPRSRAAHRWPHFKGKAPGLWFGPAPIAVIFFRPQWLGIGFHVRLSLKKVNEEH